MNELPVAALKKGLDERDYTAVQDYIANKIEQLSEKIYERKLDDLKSEYHQVRTVFLSVIKAKIKEKDVDFLFARYIGFLDAVCEFISAESEKQTVDRTIHSHSLQEIPHINGIIAVIYNNPNGIRHGILSEKIGIDKSTLSGIMERLIEKGVVTFVRPGKYKYYYLTDIGKKYYADNRSMIESDTDWDALTEKLVSALSKEEEPDRRMEEILQNISRRNQSFHTSVTVATKNSEVESTNTDFSVISIPTDNLTEIRRKYAQKYGCLQSVNQNR